jgi:hypothetical protein
MKDKEKEKEKEKSASSTIKDRFMANPLKLGKEGGWGQSSGIVTNSRGNYCKAKRN